ncbi:MAG: replicative DNA helicase [Saprospiraceae bacterium]
MEQRPKYSQPGSSPKNKMAQKVQDDADIQYSYGTVPPQALPLEEAVLGALMLDKEALTLVQDLLSPEVFYTTRHQAIYRSIVRLYDRSDPVDILTVSEELRKCGELEDIGGSHYLVELTNRVASAANIEYHSRIILQKHIQRQIIATGSQMIKDGYDVTMDCFDAIEKSEQNLFAITQNTLSRAHTEVASIVFSTLKQIEQNALKAQSSGITGVPTGIAEMDEMTGGLHNSDLGIIAARPGMGKTGLALSIAINAAERQIPVAFFSLEMANAQLTTRMLAMYSEISGHRLRNGKLNDSDWQSLGNAAEKLQGLKIYLDDTPAISIPEIRAKCRRLKRQHDIQLVIVDYLQLMQFSTVSSQPLKSTNREQEVAGISRSLKQMAKELDVPVIALSQLSRAVESRGGSKRPQLSDLRDSGAVEQDADWVSFIYRPEYYGIMEDEAGISLAGVAEIIYAKNRHGETDTVKVRFIKDFTRFISMEDATLFHAQPVANATNNPSNPVSFGGDPAFPTVEIKPVSRNDEDIPF